MNNLFQVLKDFDIKKAYNYSYELVCDPNTKVINKESFKSILYNFLDTENEEVKEIRLPDIDYDKMLESIFLMLDTERKGYLDKDNFLFFYYFLLSKLFGEETCEANFQSFYENYFK